MCSCCIRIQDQCPDQAAKSRSIVVREPTISASHMLHTIAPHAMRHTCRSKHCSSQQCESHANIAQPHHPMFQPATIAELINSTHDYLAEQQDTAAPARFSLMQSSQCRSLKLQIESWVGGCTSDAATMHLASIRDGPWRPVHINQLSEALDVAVHHASARDVCAFLS